jgi:hypothetical protein
MPGAAELAGQDTCLLADEVVHVDVVLGRRAPVALAEAGRRRRLRRDGLDLAADLVQVRLAVVV